MNARIVLSIVAAAAVSAAVMSASGQVSSTSTSSQLPSSSKRIIEVPDGLVALIQDVRVPAQEAGRLMKVHVKGGETVEEGFVLVEIDNRDTLAKQKIAQAELDVATVQANSDAEKEVAEKAIELSKIEHEINVDLRSKNPGSVSDSEFRKSKFQWDRAIAQLRVAVDDQVVAQLTTKVKEAQLEATANELARRQIVAPFKGEVNEVFRQVGEWVQPGEPVAHLVRLDKVRVKGMVYAKLASPIEVLGKPVEIVVLTAGDKERTVKGRIDFASSVIDGTGQHRAFRVWADVDNEKFVDPFTKKEAWAIQSGSSARIVIDLTPPPPPKPAAPVKAEPSKSGPGKAAPSAAPGTFRPRGSLNAPSEKVESLKPVASDAKGKAKER
jgi:multidrug efflux pump subunit AcrA (membrane-fusion protein)